MKPYYPGNLGGNDRRYNRNQNTYDSGLTNKQPGMYRRNGMHRKKPGPDTDAILTEGITAIKDYLKEITDLQKRLVGSQEQIAQAQVTHATAMQEIADCVKMFLGKAPAAPDAATPEERVQTTESASEVASPPVQTIQDESAPDAPEAERAPENSASPEAEPVGPKTEAVLKVIAEMRKNRVSFEKIADHLETEGFPPVDGNGKWNRKTVSKLFKEAAL